jgi:Amt family ammonium transporter
MKRWIGYDDSLDVFGVHGIGGVIGALGTAIVASPDLGGQGVFDYTANAVAEYNMAAQFMSQSWGVITAIIWSGVVSFVLFKLIDLTMGLRVNSDEEREGLDTVTHGERAYNL